MNKNLMTLLSLINAGSAVLILLAWIVLFLLFGPSLLKIQPATFPYLISTFCLSGIWAVCATLMTILCQHRHITQWDPAGIPTFVNHSAALIFIIVMTVHILPGFHECLSSFLKWLLP
ncbi:hypothetical protein JXQ70_03735 [bacterium]|nr:hypothetical protein [bacterium]